MLPLSAQHVLKVRRLASLQEQKFISS